MNATHLWRIAWKDYRRLRGLWIAMVLFWFVVLLILLWINATTTGSPWTTSIAEMLVGVEVTLCFYVIGWASTTFAAEVEEGTYQTLRTLPLSAGNVYGGKLVHGIVSTLALGVAIVLLCGAAHWISGPILTGSLAAGPTLHRQLLLGALAVGLSAGFGFHFSMWGQHPLRSIVLATAATLFTLYVVMVFAMSFGHYASLTDAFTQSSGLLIATLCLGCIGALLVTAYRRVYVWLPTHAFPLKVTAPVRALPQLTKRVTSPFSRRREFGRLTWLAFRQQIRTVALCGVLGVWMALASWASFGFAPNAIALVGILGIVSMRYEQRAGRYQWLGQLATRSRLYWLACSLLPLVVAGVITVLLVFGFQRGLAGQVDEVVVGVLVALMALATFAFGQFCALAFRSIIIALSVATAGTLLLWAWAALCAVLHAPIGIAVVPLAVLPFAATLLRLPRWFRMQPGARHWLLPAVPLVLLFVAVPASTAVYRVLEIPQVRLPFTEKERPLWQGGSPSAQASATGIAYQRCFEAIRFAEGYRSLDVFAFLTEEPEVPTRDAWRENSEELVNELVELSQRSECVFPVSDAVEDRTYLAAGLLMDRARERSDLGEPAAAWRLHQALLRLARQRNDGRSGQYGALLGQQIEQAVYQELVPWAMGAGNSAELVEEAAQWLDEHRQQSPPWTHVLRGDYALTTQGLEDNDIPPPSAHLHVRQDLRTLLAALLPWEVQRARRLRDYLIAQAYEELTKIEASVPHPRVQRGKNNAGIRWAALSLWPMIVAGEDYAMRAADAENTRRGIVYQLAAIAHHKRHGRYPKSFSAGDYTGPVTLPGALYSHEKMKLARFVDSDDRQQHFVVTDESSLYRSTAYEPGAERLFLLPSFEPWDRQAYLMRLALPAASTVQEQEPEAALADFIEAYPSMPLLDDVSEEPIVREATHDVVRKVLREGSSESRKVLIREILSDEVYTDRFLDDILPNLEAEDPSVAVTAAEHLLQALEVPVVKADELGVVAASDLPSRPKGIPIRAVATGHYYELVEQEEPLTWHEAHALAKRRKYRGVPGHLVTITSSDENQFLTDAWGERSQPAWAGGLRTEGAWRWMCGPEEGVAFWPGADAQDNEQHFSAWRAGEPRQATGPQYLAWNWPIAVVPGRWMNVEEDDYHVMAFLVEYSLPTED